jgi:hypothetical protein
MLMCRKFRYTGPGPGEYALQLEDMIVSFSKATASAAFHPPVSTQNVCNWVKHNCASVLLQAEYQP